MPQRSARIAKALTKLRSYVVSPLSSAPWAYPSRRDDEICDILERNEETIRSKTKSCKTCQVNKKRTRKYGHLPPKIVISTPWEALCVDLVGPYTLKGKDGSSIDFMALTMIDPASSWFEIVELPTIYRLITKKENGKERTIEEEIFDKSSDRIARLVNKIWLCRYPRCRYLIIARLVDRIWLCRYPRCRYLIYDTGSEFKLHFETQRKPTTIKNPKANAIL